MIIDTHAHYDDEQFDDEPGGNPGEDAGCGNRHDNGCRFYNPVMG